MSNNHKKKLAPATGTIRVHPRGFGFLIPDDRTRFPEDIFIPRRATKGAVDGDIVEVAVNQFISEKGPEGVVEKILRRSHSHVAGTITYINTKNIYAYVPLLGEDMSMRILPSEERVLKIGDRIIIDVQEWGSEKRESVGKMRAYIGHISDPSCDVAAAIEEYELDDDFSQKILDEARAFGDSLSKEDLTNREDLRKLICFTIDPDTAKDFDDALSLTKQKNGDYHLGVHIADVSHYVKLGSELDIEAKQRCNSVYFPGTVLPMLPHELSSHLCSLQPDVDRLAISVVMVLDPTGRLKNYRITRSVINSKKRFTYREAKKVLDGTNKSPYLDKLELMVELCGHLKRLRAERGSIEFSLPDLSLQIDANGVPQKVEIVEYDITHQLVEEFMLKANEVIATHLSKEGKPLAYRVHAEPNPENITEFAATASALGFTISDNPDAAELQKLFDEARETPFGPFLAMQFIRSMKLANYSTQNIGHYGLGLEFYTHFTSPIRRYIDLLVHRLLFEEVDPKQNFEKIALHCSEKERLSSRAENAVTLLKKLRLLQAMESAEPNRTYKAVVTGIKPFGFSFEVGELMLEGYISAESRYKTGDKIEVELVRLDLITKEVLWEIKRAKKMAKKSGKRGRTC